ncbi:integrase [Bacillus cereus]|nr:integrase [Bacillus cereus]
MSKIKVDEFEFYNANIYTHLDKLKQQLKQKGKSFGDFSFNDDTWFCNKLINKVAYPSEYTIKFNNISSQYKESLKYYCLLAIPDITVSTVKDKIKYFKDFLDYLKLYFPDYKLANINRKIISQYEQYLNENISSKPLKRHKYGAITSILNTLSDFPNFPSEILTKKSNPFNEETTRNPENYIPESVVQQLDTVMLDETNGIPLCLRLTYWLQRSFPNRIREVCSINVNCLKALYSYYTISIPTTKENGGYLSPEFKLIPVLNTGHGIFIINLIKKMKEKQKEFLKVFPVDKLHENLLILSPTYTLRKEGEILKVKYYAENCNEIKKIYQQYPSLSPKEVSNILKDRGIDLHPQSVKRYLKLGLQSTYRFLKPYTAKSFNKLLNQVCSLFDITDDKGNVFKITSHQFRHNATTDRLYAGYTIDQVRTIKGDKNKSFLYPYSHQQKELHKKMWLESTQLQSPNQAPVEFRGIITNLADPIVTQRLQRNPATYLTWETNGKKGVGLCSNILGCHPKGTSIHFECYECDWFVPKAEYIDDYQKELEYWIEKMDKTANSPNRAATFENAIRNVNILERIISICKNGIQKHKISIHQKAKKGGDNE